MNSDLIKITWMDRELNAHLLASSECNLSIVLAIIGVPLFPISSHFRFMKLLYLILLFQLVINVLNQLFKSYSIGSTCDNYIDLTCKFELASIEFCISIQWIKSNDIKYRKLFGLNYIKLTVDNIAKIII